jgi:hypothetical protein
MVIEINVLILFSISFCLTEEFEKGRKDFGREM